MFKYNLSNKKGVLLVEASISVLILGVLLVMIGQIYVSSGNIRERARELTTSSQVDRVKNLLTYVQQRAWSQWQTTNYALQNKLYAGWTDVIVSTNGQSFEQLSGAYKLVYKTGCPWYLEYCLSPLNTWEYDSVPANYLTTNYKTDSQWKFVYDNYSLTNPSTCSALSKDCLGYTLTFTDVVNSSNSYQDVKEVNIAAGTERTIKDKKTVTVKLDDWENPKIYNYIMSLTR